MSELLRIEGVVHGVLAPSSKSLVSTRNLNRCTTWSLSEWRTASRTALTVKYKMWQLPSHITALLHRGLPRGAACAAIVRTGRVTRRGSPFSLASHNGFSRVVSSPTSYCTSSASAVSAARRPVASRPVRTMAARPHHHQHKRLPAADPSRGITNRTRCTVSRRTFLLVAAIPLLPLAWGAHPALWTVRLRQNKTIGHQTTNPNPLRWRGRRSNRGSSRDRHQ